MQEKSMHLKSRNITTEEVAQDLLSWYDMHHRKLPWRADPNTFADPYHVWLSEVMLQQTTVATVGPYFEKFLKKWPRVEDMAAAELDEVLSAWAGLGYYARARNLYKCAQLIVSDYKGQFPKTEQELLKLPGVGPYTAAAIAAIAFGEAATILDGNVERVISRLFNIHDPLPKSKERLRAMATTVTPQKRAGDYAQAIMDLGATICTPTSPKCILCPIRPACAAFEAGCQSELPKKLPKVPKPVRQATMFFLRSGEQIYVRKRPTKGLLGGMLELPSTAWNEGVATPDEILKATPFKGDWQLHEGVVRHVFTHFKLELTLMSLILDEGQRPNFEQGYWINLSEIEEVALPTVMRKAIKHVVSV